MNTQKPHHHDDASEHAQQRRAAVDAAVKAHRDQPMPINPFVAHVKDTSALRPSTRIK